MKKIKILLVALIAFVILVTLILVLLIRTSPQQPLAVIRVVDAAGKPVAGAVIRPDGLRLKEGVKSGHSLWTAKSHSVAPETVTTDADGRATLPYPRYAFERIETGQLSFSVNHPDFVPERPFRAVATTPPAGAPWQAWANYYWDRIKHKTIIVQTEPVALQQGAVLKFMLRPDAAHPYGSQLFAQVFTESYQDTNFWTQPQSGMLMTSRLAPGQQIIRPLQVRPDGSVFFGPILSLTAGAGRTNIAIIGLKPALAVHGKLDDTVPRPVKNGRVVAHVWPLGYKPESMPPEWHAWTTIRDDGGFDIPSLPHGTVEIVALCDGFISTNGPGEFPGFRYPQKHVFGTNDLNVTIGMEPTVRLEVSVADDKGKPLAGAVASAGPNVRYGETASAVLMSDCYNTLDRYLGRPSAESADPTRPVPGFSGTSDGGGLAIIPNLPTDVNEFSVEHPNYVLPAVFTASGDQVRLASISLKPGITNRISVELEPRGRSPIKSY